MFGSPVTSHRLFSLLIAGGLWTGCVPWSDSDLDGDGWATEDGDCDDGDDAVHPSVADGEGDGIDRNCDGHDGIDQDGDGEASRASGGVDCDDRVFAVNTAAVELCNGIDDDCDDLVDIEAEDAQSFWRDEDGDSYGTGDPEHQCSPLGASWIDRDGDCDDSHAVVHPMAVEACAYDFDCDGLTVPCAPLLGPLSPTDGLSFDGLVAGSEAGWSVAVVGDVDGDGHVDLAIGAPAADLTWIVRGPIAQGFSLANATKIVGPSGARSGVAVDGLGDVDDDGFDDLVIGAEFDDAGGENAGAAWLVHGPITNSLSLATSAHQLIGATSGSHAGHAVAGVYDADGDGRRDVLIGAWSAGGGGAAYLMPADTVFNVNMGSATVIFEGTMGEGAGWSVASGDLDGDGLSDSVIGAPYNGAGSAYVSLGRVGVPGATILLANSDTAIRGGDVGDRTGWALAVGDANGDGTDDLWVSAPLASDDAGGAWFFQGGVGAWSGERSIVDADASLVGLPGEGVGQSLAVVSDVHGDGRGELVVAGGADTGITDSGVVWLFSGPAPSVLNTSNATAVIVGLQEGDRLGAGLTAGDINLDGHGDLLIGVPGAGELGWGPGGALLLWGG